jgi:protein O-GlcNAcase / histone acetyltransferase
MLVEEPLSQERDLTEDDLILMCELFYLPFEHGAQGAQLLQEFMWLKANAPSVIRAKSNSDSAPEARISHLLVKPLLI